MAVIEEIIQNVIIEELVGGTITEVIIEAQIIEIVTQGTCVIGGETGFPWYLIPDPQTVRVGENRQMAVHGGLIVDGNLIVDGQVVVI